MSYTAYKLPLINLKNLRVSESCIETISNSQKVGIFLNNLSHTTIKIAVAKSKKPRCQWKLYWNHFPFTIWLSWFMLASRKAWKCWELEAVPGVSVSCLHSSYELDCQWNWLDKVPVTLSQSLIRTVSETGVEKLVRLQPSSRDLDSNKKLQSEKVHVIGLTRLSLCQSTIRTILVLQM